MGAWRARGLVGFYSPRAARGLGSGDRLSGFVPQRLGHAVEWRRAASRFGPGPRIRPVVLHRPRADTHARPPCRRALDGFDCLAGMRGAGSSAAATVSRRSAAAVGLVDRAVVSFGCAGRGAVQGRRLAGRASFRSLAASPGGAQSALSQGRQSLACRTLYGPGRALARAYRRPRGPHRRRGDEIAGRSNCCTAGRPAVARRRQVLAVGNRRVAPPHRDDGHRRHGPHAHCSRSRDAHRGAVWAGQPVAHRTVRIGRDRVEQAARLLALGHAIPACMDQISVDEVVRAVELQLARDIARPALRRSA